MPKKNIHKIVGSKIKHLREENNLTQKQLGDLVFSSQSVINKIEKGNRKIDIDRLIRFSKVLNRDIVYFLSDFVD